MAEFKSYGRLEDFLDELQRLCRKHEVGLTVMRQGEVWYCGPDERSKQKIGELSYITPSAMGYSGYKGPR
jgi:hypothetical protein